VQGESDGEVDEREGEAVVQPGLGGERESDLVLVLLPRRADLDAGGEHGVGGGERGAEQERRRRRQAEQPPAEQGDAGDRERHGDAEEAPRGHPAAPAERPVELQPGAHERHDDDQLGQALGDVGVLHQVGLDAGARDAEQRHAEQHADDGQREREAAQERRQPGHGEDDQAEAGQEDDVPVHLTGRGGQLVEVVAGAGAGRIGGTPGLATPNVSDRVEGQGSHAVTGPVERGRPAAVPGRRRLTAAPHGSSLTHHRRRPACPARTGG
jgi:hypothetical protein